MKTTPISSLSQLQHIERDPPACERASGERELRAVWQTWERVESVWAEKKLDSTADID